MSPAKAFSIFVSVFDLFAFTMRALEILIIIVILNSLSDNSKIWDISGSDACVVSFDSIFSLLLCFVIVF